MEKDADFLGKYRSISNKLKKRFLKKPNVAEGSEQFASLAKTLRQQECAQYAGFCCLAQARCEHTLANAPGEAQALTDAARAFLEAENASAELRCPSFQEHLNAAINCYSHAIRVHIENQHPALAASLCLQMAHALKCLNRPGEAVAHYQRAAQLQIQNPLDCLTSLGHVATCKIETRKFEDSIVEAGFGLVLPSLAGDYEGALGVLTEMAYLAQERGMMPSGKPIGAFCDILARCEVTRVLLLMLLQPTPQRIRPEHAQTLEKYAWETTDESIPVNCIDEELFLLLQSVVMACQSHDLESLRALQTELWSQLTPETNHLLHLVLQELTHPAGDGY